MAGILIQYFVFYAFLFIAVEKLKLQDRLLNSKYKLLYKVGKCDFCLGFWIACFTVLVVQSTVNYDLTDIFTPFAIMGLWLIFQEFKK